MAIDEAEEVNLGDVIVLLAEESLRAARDEKEAGIMAANIFTDLLHNAEPISTRWH